MAAPTFSEFISCLRHSQYVHLIALRETVAAQDAEIARLKAVIGQLQDAAPWRDAEPGATSPDLPGGMASTF